MLTDAESAELAALRQRAYDADSDIALDPRALARLTELEERARLDRAPRAPEEPRATVPAGSGSPASPTAVRRVARRQPRTAGRRVTRVPEIRRWWVAGGAAALAIAAAVAVLGPTGILSRRPTASPSPTPAALTCAAGSGAGPEIPEGADPVRSPQWDAEPPPGSGQFTIMPDGAPPWRALLTPVQVAGGIAAVVRVVDPGTARLAMLPVPPPSADTKNAQEVTGPGPDQLVADGRRSLLLPICASRNTYPLIVMSERDACVHLWITVAEGASYPATVAVGDVRCG